MGKVFLNNRNKECGVVVMNRMVMFIGVSAVMFELGCSSPQTAEVESLEMPSANVPTNTLSLEMLSTSGSNAPINALIARNYRFELNNLFQLEILDQEADMADLAAFAIDECWERRLREKLDDGEPLCEMDIRLLAFCWDVQLQMAGAICGALLKDYTGDRRFLDDFNRIKDTGGVHGKNVELATDETGEDVDKMVQDLSRKFAESDGADEQAHVVRKAVYDYASKFASVGLESRQWAQLYSWVINDERMSTRDSKRVKHYQKWLWPFDAIENPSRLKRNDLKKALGKIKSYRQKDFIPSLIMLESVLAKYQSQMRSMRISASKYKCRAKGGGRSEEMMQFLLKRFIEDTERFGRFVYSCIYDIPLAMLSERAYAEILLCKGRTGFWHWVLNDDEQGMMDAARRFARDIGGVHLIKKCRSVYAATAYHDVLDLLKHELNDGEYKALVAQSKLYNFTLSDVVGENELNEP